MQVRLENVTKKFPGVTAVNTFSVTLPDGELICLLGPSGCGKSTILNMLSGILPVSGGDIYFDEDNVTKLPPEERGIGLVFQNYALYPHMTVLENICFPLELVGTPKKEARKRAAALLETVGLPDKAGAYPVQLSGGQKQRVAIARALASNPEVLLCDEATSALDPKTTRETLRLLRQINQELGVTVIIITHDMKVIEEICGRVAILNHGQVAEIGAVEEVFSNPKTEASRRLVYPDGLPFEMLPGSSRIIRVAFNGGTAYQPLIASLAIDCGVKVNILGADTRSIDGKAFGTMLLGLPESEAEAAKALAYITSQKNITVEEVRDYHG